MPTEPRHLATWLSPRDAVGYIRAALTAPPSTRFATVYAVSANARRFWELAEPAVLAYVPVDDAELHAGDLGTHLPADLAAPQAGPYALPEYTPGPPQALILRPDVARRRTRSTPSLRNEERGQVLQGYARGFLTGPASVPGHAGLPTYREDFMPTPYEPMGVPDERRWYAANELLAFLLELAALVCLSWWGFTVGDNEALHIVLGAGTPCAAIVLWSLFAAPKARLRPRLALVLIVKAVVLGGGAAALYGTRHPVLAVIMAVVVVANTAVAEVFRRRPATSRAARAAAAVSPASDG